MSYNHTDETPKTPPPNNRIPGPTFDQFLALLLLCGCLALLFCGINGEVKAILALAAGWLFRASYNNRRT